MDVDGSGYVDKKELMTFIRGTGATEEEAEQQADHMIKSIDVDGDGEINYTEFRDARLSSNLANDKVIIEEFNKIDADGNGFITNEELMQLFNWTLATDMITKMIAEIDENNDGQIRKKENTNAKKKTPFAAGL